MKLTIWLGEAAVMCLPVGVAYSVRKKDPEESKKHVATYIQEVCTQSFQVIKSVSRMVTAPPPSRAYLGSLFSR